MNAATIFLIITGVVVGTIAVAWLFARHEPERVVEAGLDEVRQTIPEARGRAYQRVLARFEDALAAERASLDRIARRLDYLARSSIDESASFIAEHRRALSHWLLGFDAAAQVGITAVQRADLPWMLYLLVGCGLAAIYAFLGVMATWVVILLFRQRPQRGWFYLDLVALVSGSLAIAAALALLLARGVTDAAAASAIEVTMGMIGSPLIVWGGFAAGLLAGVAHHQSEEERLGRRRRRRERCIAVWDNGLAKLRGLGTDLGLVALLFGVLSAGSSELNAQDSARLAAAAVAVVTQNDVTAKVAIVPGATACLAVVDGSTSPDTAHFQKAIDTALTVVMSQVKRHRCIRLLGMVVSADTVWAARRWFELPAPLMDSATCAKVDPPTPTNVWGAAFRAISPSAGAGSKLSAQKTCGQRASSAQQRFQEEMGLLVRAVKAFLSSARPIGTLDTTAVVEMVQFAGSGRFAAAIVVTDAVETKLPGPLPELRLTCCPEIVMMVAPTNGKYGGTMRSTMFARAFSGRAPTLLVVPYTDPTPAREGAPVRARTVVSSDGQVTRP